VGEDPFPVALPAGTVHCRILEGGRSVSVEMGRVSFRSEGIPVAGPPREVLRERIEVAGRALEFSAVGVGNPHCVIFTDAVGEAEVRALGPALEVHPLFPRRTNVQLVRVEDRATLRIGIWERGAGYTLASGTSACAAAAVAHRLGRCDRTVRVLAPGGALAVEIGPAWDVTLTGPVTRVAEGSFQPEAFADGG
jgi:diaminopimelate epimerase